MKDRNKSKVTRKKQPNKVEIKPREVIEVEESIKRGDTEIIVNDEHYQVDFNELLKFFDAYARDLVRWGPSSAHDALAKILGFTGEYHDRLEKARALILTYKAN